MKNNNDNLFGTVETVKKIGISAERLRYWERAGIVEPEYVNCGTRKFRRFSQEDINKAITVRSLVDRDKYTLEGAIKKFEKESSV
jgi:DNA-binding transcriptional MerR regulator